MQLSLTLDIPPLPAPIRHTDKLLLVGSCFTEHISDRLQQHKFTVVQNPHGILFNPLSVASSLNSYVAGKQYAASDLFCLNELWNSWDHHTRFSHTDQLQALAGINESQQVASAMVRQADWIMITLGSAFQYYLKENGQPVANNHRAPAQWFEKRMLSITDIITALSNCITNIATVNPKAHILLTISPVRHIRDGVTDNNRSKARLIEAVHELCAIHTNADYFPAYELVIDILRDYRYYDIDFVHPNYMATSYVWEHFVKACIAADAYDLMARVNDLMTAKGHRTRFPDTDAHRRFKESYLAKTQSLKAQYPYLQLEDVERYFQP
jgi:hypothetical protein